MGELGRATVVHIYSTFVVEILYVFRQTRKSFKSRIREVVWLYCY